MNLKLDNTVPAGDNMFYDLIRYSEMFGDDMMTLLMLDDNRLNDYMSCCRRRISEEIQTRIETGVSRPLESLKWYTFGKGWETLKDKEVPFN